MHALSIGLYVFVFSVTLGCASTSKLKNDSSSVKTCKLEDASGIKTHENRHNSSVLFQKLVEWMIERRSMLKNPYLSPGDVPYITFVVVQKKWDMGVLLSTSKVIVAQCHILKRRTDRRNFGWVYAGVTRISPGKDFAGITVQKKPIASMKAFPEDDGMGHLLTLIETKGSFEFNEYVSSIPIIGNDRIPEALSLPCKVINFTQEGEEYLRYFVHHLNVSDLCPQLEDNGAMGRDRDKRKGLAMSEDFEVKGPQIACSPPIHLDERDCKGECVNVAICQDLFTAVAVKRAKYLPDGSCSPGSDTVYRYIGYYAKWIKEQVPDVKTNMWKTGSVRHRFSPTLGQTSPRHGMKASQTIRPEPPDWLMNHTRLKAEQNHYLSQHSEALHLKSLDSINKFKTETSNENSERRTLNTVRRRSSSVRNKWSPADLKKRKTTIPRWVVNYTRSKDELKNYVAPSPEARNLYRLKYAKKGSEKVPQKDYWLGSHRNVRSGSSSVRRKPSHTERIRMMSTVHPRGPKWPPTSYSRRNTYGAQSSEARNLYLLKHIKMLSELDPDDDYEDCEKVPIKKVSKVTTQPTREDTPAELIIKIPKVFPCQVPNYTSVNVEPNFCGAPPPPTPPPRSPPVKTPEPHCAENRHSKSASSGSSVLNSVSLAVFLTPWLLFF